MSELPSNHGSGKPDTVSLYVGEFQRRFVEFERGRQREMRVMKHDFVARLFTDHIVLGDKQTYDGMLQGILNDQEHERLETDPRFTRAWRIFVDLCWLRKQFARAGLILGAVLIILTIVLFLIWAFPYLTAPEHR